MPKQNNTNFLNANRDKIANTLKLFDVNNLDKDSFCVMPFTNIILEPDGNIGVCRHKGHQFTFGNIREKSIEEIWSSLPLQKWREEHLAGNIKTCSNEISDRKCNLCPELNVLLPNAEITNVVSPKILRLTANLNGKCNLQCQMCSIWKEPNGFYNEANFWAPAKASLFKQIEEIDFLSGEPFIQDDTYRFIEEISQINPSCKWSFTTNLHWKLNKSIKCSLDKIIIKYFLISLDSLNSSTYHKIRYPGDLNFVLKNIDHILEYENERINFGKSNLNLKINFLIQQDNFKEVKSAINYCLERKITPFISFLYGPKKFSLLDLSKNERMNILDYYFSHLSKDELLFSQRVIKPLLRSLDKIDYIYYLQNFQNLIN